MLNKKFLERLLTNEFISILQHQWNARINRMKINKKFDLWIAKNFYCILYLSHLNNILVILFTCVKAACVAYYVQSLFLIYFFIGFFFILFVFIRFLAEKYNLSHVVVSTTVPSQSWEWNSAGLPFSYTQRSLWERCWWKWWHLSVFS